MLVGVHESRTPERVVFGSSAGKVVLQQAVALKARRVFAVTSRSLADHTLLRDMAAALGDRFAGAFTRVEAHTPRSCVIAGSTAAREAGADLILAFGGGSVIDGAKAMQLCLWRDITTPDELGAARATIAQDADAALPQDGRAPIRTLAVPTTLSAAEFTPVAGVMDTATQMKEAYDHPLFVPRVVVLDPRATLATPEWLMLSTGIRAVDHAVETFCSSKPTPFSDPLAGEALRLLVRALPRLKQHPDDVENRLTCQLGAWLSILGFASGVPVGASHTIGRVLGGSFGVPHGRTSCVLLPAVLRWNAAHADSAARQAELNALIGAPAPTLADVVAELVSALGEPRTLRDIGIDRAAFPVIAENSLAMLRHHSVAGNPRPVTGAEDIFDILELAW